MRVELQLDRRRGLVVEAQDKVLDDLHVILGRAHDDRVRADLGGDADHFVRQGPGRGAAPAAFAALAAATAPAAAAEHPHDVRHRVGVAGLRLHRLLLEDVVQRLGGLGRVRVLEREDLDLQLGGRADVDHAQDAHRAADALGAPGEDDRVRRGQHPNAAREPEVPSAVPVRALRSSSPSSFWTSITFTALRGTICVRTWSVSGMVSTSEPT